MQTNLQLQEVQEVQKQQPTSQSVVVDLAEFRQAKELKRVETNLKLKVLSRFSTNTQCVFYNKTGKHPYKTMVSFINSGHTPLGIQGLTKLMKEQNYATRLEGLQCLEAYVAILTNRSGEFAEIRNLNDITPELIDLKRNFIQSVKKYQ